KGHSPGSAWIDLEHVYLAGANRKLNIHQPNDVQGTAEFHRVLSDALAKILAQLIRGQHAGTVSRMDSGFFDVFHDAANHDLLVITQRIDVDFISVFQEFIDEDGPLWRDLYGRLHIVVERRLVVHDHHRTAT